MNLGAMPSNTATTKTDWAGIISGALPAVIAARNQDRVMRENLSRQRAGLAPLDVDAYKPGVKVGLDKGTLYLIAAVVAAVLLYLLTRKRKA